jgi:CHAT domain-containing protein
VSQPAVTIDELQARVLRPGELLLEFFVGSNESYVVAVTRDDLRIVRLPGPDSPFAESVDLYHRILASPDAQFQTDYPPARLATIQSSIGMTVTAELTDLVEDAQCVFVAPDGFLASIPFGTLMVTESSGLLMETKDVVQVPSASVLALQRSREIAPCEGAPRLVALEGAESSELSGAHDEVRDLASRYAGVQLVRGLAGGAADLAAVSGQCDVLHVATHALVVDHSPWQSGLQLALDAEAVGSAADTVAIARDFTAGGTAILSAEDSSLVARAFKTDPFVRAWQIARLSLPTRLTVLAACETAGGRLTTGEGVLGLTAAFMSAGVPVVVSSLWPVDDQATAVVIGHFYRYLARGESVATALRLAQLDTRRSKGLSHPFYWAGFTVVGDGSIVVGLEERTGVVRPVLLALACASLLAGAVLLLRRRRHGPAPA